MLDEVAGKVVLRSAWMENEALVHPDWPISNPRPYLNGVVVLESELEPRELLETLFSIERRIGRCREREKVRWGPRIIDLDIIAYGHRVVQTEGLLIPHPEMHRREFVLQPMFEVIPEWRHPILGKTVGEMISALRARRRYV